MKLVMSSAETTHTKLNSNQEKMPILTTKPVKTLVWNVCPRKTQHVRTDMLNAITWEGTTSQTNASKLVFRKSNSMRWRTVRYHANKRCSTCTLSMTRQNSSIGTDAIETATKLLALATANATT